MTRALFLDRDGVVNDVVERGSNFYVQGKKVEYSAPFTFEEFRLREGVSEFISAVKSRGYRVILVSNQPDIAYGNLSPEDHARIMGVVSELGCDDIYVCLHGRTEGCECKKPKPGMLLAAAKKWSIELENSFMLGDTVSDVRAAQAAGCRSILFGSRDTAVGADFYALNFNEVITLLTK